jgi:transcriptional regulator with XRE-family HTH domain
MNFGDKLKQIRTQKNMTQPQMAEAIGIEQSYLSKLENDKSVPSADMFQAILRSLDMDPKEFLKDIDRKILQTSLKQIPEVAAYLNTSMIVKTHNVKQWLFGSAFSCILGFAFLLGANEGVFFSNNLYKYDSPGVFLKNEAEDVFDQFEKILNMKFSAKIITSEEASRQLAEFNEKRKRPLVVEKNRDLGTVFYEDVEGGRRKFDRVQVTYVRSFENRVLQFIGGLFIFAGILGFFMEWRLRKLQTP